MNNDDLTVPVLIVGGGGAGLTASMLLSTLGVDSLLVNARPTTSTLPKAHVLNLRAMEVLQDVGAADRITAVGTPPQNMAATAWYVGLAGSQPEHGRRLAKIESWGGGGASAEWLAASPMIQANLPQIRLEPLLRQRAEELAPGKIRFNHEVTSIEQDEDGVTATVLNHDTESTYVVRAQYLLACDAGRTVGPSLGVELVGLREVVRVVSIHITADLSQWATDPDVLIRWLVNPDRGLGAALVPMGPTKWASDSEEWVFHQQYEPEDMSALDDESVIADMRVMLGIGDHPIKVNIITRWWIEGIVADRFQVGRTFFCGDAAHRHPPTGGLGLTSAIHDVHNITWKLAQVLGGHATPDLLATYEAERLPVDTANVQRSVENALNHIGATPNVGGNPGADSEENWANLRRFLADDADDVEYRREITRMLISQSMEFDELNIEYGYTYESTAVVPDGTPKPENVDPARIYQPSARPGHPLPHAWLTDWDGNRLALFDLVRPGRFLLIASEEGQEWEEAGRILASVTGIPLDVVRIGHLDGDYLDSRSSWTRQRGVGTTGAVLVRPDRFVAWRSFGGADDAKATLLNALNAILSR